MNLTGQKVAQANFKSIKSTVDSIFGPGSGPKGYGQPIVSDPNIGDIISASNWQNLRDTMVKARQHQLGIAIENGVANDGLNLADISAGDVITDSIRQQYYDFATDIVVNKDKVHPLELQDPVTIINKTRTISWNNVLSYDMTVSGKETSVSASHNLRYFFNAGGKITITPRITGGSSTNKQKFWRDNLLPKVDSIILSSLSTVSTGNSGTAYDIGFNDLTTAEQTIFKIFGTGVYATNYFTVSASVSADRSDVIFHVSYCDLADDGSSVDTNINGILSTLIEQSQPDSANVSVEELVALIPVTESGSVVTTFSIIPDILTVNETTTNDVVFSVTCSESSARTLSWTTIGTVEANDFADKVLSGTVVLDGNGEGTITRTIATDKMYDGPETFQIQLYEGAVLRKTSAIITVLDTSNYEITAPASVYEGATFKFTVTSTTAANSNRLFVTLRGMVGDISNIGTAQGYIDIVNGAAEKSILVPLDRVNNTRSFVIELRTGSSVGPVVASTPVNNPIEIIDKSHLYSVVYSTADNILTEGETLYVTVNTTNVANGTVLMVYFENHPTVPTAGTDFVGGYAPKAITINNNSGTCAITVAKNGGTEGPRYFRLNIYEGSYLFATSQYFLLRAHGVAVYYASGGVYYFTVPTGVTQVNIQAVGPGGGSAGWHDSGYGTYAVPGGPGGAVDAWLPVTPGSVITVTLGVAGGPGRYGGSDWTWGYGAKSSSTYITYNGFNYIIAACGNNSVRGSTTNHRSGTSYKHPSLPGATYNGSPSYETGGHEWGYSTWYNISVGRVKVGAAGTPPALALPSGVSSDAGRAERAGWVAIYY